jgi:lysyl-tRNA synthetase class II
MGVDRLLMILTGHETLREVVPFPVMRELRAQLSEDSD